MNRDDLIKELGRIIDVGIVNAHHDKAVLEEIQEELQKPVIVLTAGCYSDYHIVGVSFDKDTAERINQATYDSNPIEYYVPIEWAEGSADVNFEKEAFMRVEWAPDTNEIVNTSVDNWQGTEYINGYDRFCFFISVRSRTARDAFINGKNSELLKKVAQDKYAEYQNRQLEKRYRQFGGT